ncbi:MAG TPA: nitroreductase family protein, partial [Paludibacter sp.]|nr:nitroreductase family protein [Paludibacter sp.]
SSINSQPWKFVFVSNEEIKGKLADVSSFNGQRINEASHLIVFCSINSIEKFEEQIRANISKSAQEYYNEVLKPLSDSEIKSWLNHQVYLSLGFFLSACASLEIDTTTMEGINNKEYDKILNLTDYTTLFAVALGYRDEEDANQLKFKPKVRLPIDKIIQTI